MRLATEERETAEDRPPSAPRSARLGGTDIFRGALVILTAVVIGGFVISRGLDDPAGTDTTEVAAASAGADGDSTGEDTGATGTLDDTAAGTGDQTGQEVLPDDGTASESTAGIGSAVTDDTTMTGDTTAGTTTTVAPAGPRPADQVRVLVLNGAGTQGIAARGTEAMQAAGYTTADPKNADAPGASAILYTEGYELDAAAVASVFATGLEMLIAPLDDTNRPVDDIQGAHIVVVIGNDGTIPVP